MGMPAIRRRYVYQSTHASVMDWIPDPGTRPALKPEWRAHSHARPCLETIAKSKIPARPVSESRSVADSCYPVPRRVVRRVFQTGYGGPGYVREFSCLGSVLSPVRTRRSADAFRQHNRAGLATYSRI